MRRRAIYASIVALAAGWLAISHGIVSSNDGSHIALGRALLRGETSIDRDVGLTLHVDRARRDGRFYSDRPPGTAFLALPALWLGRLLDAPLSRATVERRRVVVAPATLRFAGTYQARERRAPPLYRYQGTRLAIAVHTAVVGLLGLLCLVWLLERRGVDTAGRLFAVITTGAGTLWGPYSTMLFSHVSSATLLAALVLLAERAQPARVETESADVAKSGGPGAPSGQPWLSAAGSGLCAGFAMATNYALVVAVPLLAALVLPLSAHSWAAAAAGAVLPLAATALYHRAAFGSVFALGYDFQTNFRFARQRSSTFSGNPLAGLWTLWGGGDGGAGLLAQSPVALVGLFFLARDARARRWLLALLPWALLLLFHKTPGGGGTSDHRYLIPLLPFVGVGLGLAWQALEGRRARWRWGLVALAIFSAAHVWLHFFAWRG